eukprot:1196315-Prorocentrum_minimum.AAC.6
MACLAPADDSDANSRRFGMPRKRQSYGWCVSARLSPMLAFKGWKTCTAVTLSCTRRQYANATLSHRPQFNQNLLPRV